MAIERVVKLMEVLAVLLGLELCVLLSLWDRQLVLYWEVATAVLLVGLSILGAEAEWVEQPCLHE